MPTWRGGKHKEEETFKNSLIKTFEIAKELKISSLSFSIFFAAKFEFPQELGARILSNSIIK